MVRAFCLVLLSTAALAQPKFESIASYHYVHSVAVDHDTIWAATAAGVLKYHKNGTLLKTYTNVDGLIHNQVTSVFIDSKGNKWFGTEYGGISRLSGNQWRSYSQMVLGSALGINAITEDKTGNIWFASNGRGTAKFNGTVFTFYSITTTGIAPSYSLAVDASGKVWAGLVNSVASFDGTNWTSYSIPGASSIESISIDSKGDKWFGHFSGVTRLSGSTLTTFGKAHFQVDDIKSSYVDTNDNLWMGVASGRVGKGLVKYSIATQEVLARYTDPVGEIQQISKVGADLYLASGNLLDKGKLYRYDGSNWFTYSKENSFGGFTTTAILVDANANTWFATRGGGVTKFDGSTYTVYNSSNSGLLSNDVFSLATTSNGDIYAGMIGGVVMVFRGGAWTLSYTATGRVNRMDVDSQDNVWIASENGGAARYNGTSWTTYKVSNSGIVSDQLWSIQIDSHDNVWIGSYDNKGISLFSNGTFTTFNKDNSGLGGGIVQDIMIDKDDVVWAGIYETGVYKYKQGQWTKAYSTTNSPLPNNSIYSMCVDLSGRHWFASAYGEVGYAAVFNGTAWRVFTYDHGLISSGASWVAPDNAGNIWVGAFWGVSKISGDPYGKLDQTITLDPIANKAMGDAQFTLAAYTSSNLPITFSTTSDKVSIVSNRVAIVKPGRAVVKAEQAGNDYYKPATTERSFCIQPPKPTITIVTDNTGTSLKSSSTTGNQWFRNGVAISGETNETLKVATEGLYKVQVKIDDCLSSEFSDDQSLVITGVYPEQVAITVYPNPATEYLEVHGAPGEIQSVRVLNMLGRSMSLDFDRNGEGTLRTSVQQLLPGVYVLELRTESAVSKVRFIRQ
jgi:ligand-binding sensor domain-containing protein